MEGEGREHDARRVPGQDHMSIRQNEIIWPEKPKEEPVEIQIDQHTYMKVEPGETPHPSAEPTASPQGEAKRPKRRKRSEGSE